VKRYFAQKAQIGGGCSDKDGLVATMIVVVLDDGG